MGSCEPCTLLIVHGLCTLQSWKLEELPECFSSTLEWSEARNSLEWCACYNFSWTLRMPPNYFLCPLFTHSGSLFQEPDIRLCGLHTRIGVIDVGSSGSGEVANIGLPVFPINFLCFHLKTLVVFFQCFEESIVDHPQLHMNHRRAGIAAARKIMSLMADLKLCF